MSIRIVTKTYESAAGQPEARDSYLEKIVKYIPSEVVSAWFFVKNAVKALAGAEVQTTLWALLAVFVLITAALKHKQTHLPVQTAISTGAFLVWAFALGDPLATNPTQQVWASLAVVVYALVVGSVNPD